MKEMVVKEMDLETRSRLKMCSKTDKYLVESTPILYDELDIRVVNNRFNKSLNVTLGMESKLGMRLRIAVTDDAIEIIKTPFPPVSLLSCEEYKKQIPCSSKEEGKKLVENIIRSILFDGNLRFDTATIFIDVPDFLKNDDCTIHAKHLIIYELSSQTVEWLIKVAPKVKSVTLPAVKWNRGDYMKNLGTIPAVVNAQKIEIEHYSDINDEQLLNFECTSLNITRKSKITEKGINQLIKKAIANDYPIGTQFKINIEYWYYDSSTAWNWIFEGLDVEVTDFIDDEYDEEGYDVTVFGFREGIIRMKQDKQMNVYIHCGEFIAEIH